MPLKEYLKHPLASDSNDQPIGLFQIHNPLQNLSNGPLSDFPLHMRVMKTCGTFIVHSKNRMSILEKG
jgi:hypothetical protein